MKYGTKTTGQSIAENSSNWIASFFVECVDVGQRLIVEFVHGLKAYAGQAQTEM